MHGGVLKEKAESVSAKWDVTMTVPFPHGVRAGFH